MSKPAHKSGPRIRKEVKEFAEEVIQIDRVTRVVKGGRKLRFRATVVIGNKKGKVGIGLGKSHEVTGAIQKAIAQAKKTLKTMNLDDNTIPHEINEKFKAAKVLLFPAIPGTGLIAGGTVRKVLELTGVKDVLSKSIGSNNKVNIAKATFNALGKMETTPSMIKKEQEKSKKLNFNTQSSENQIQKKKDQPKEEKQEPEERKQEKDQPKDKQPQPKTNTPDNSTEKKQQPTKKED